MNLEQYVTDLCAKLREGKEVSLEALMDMPYRHLIASVLQNNLTGPASTVVEGLLNQVVSSQNNVSYLMEESRNLRADINDLQNPTPRVKREIQSAPKIGSIPKKKIEASVNAVRIKANKDAV